MTRNYTRTVAKGGFWKTARSGVRTLFADNGAGGIQAVAFRVEKTRFDAVMDPVAESRRLVADILAEEAAKAFSKAFAKE
jgi:hypothetical protein